MSLGQDGLNLEGGLTINGRPLEDMVREIAREAARELLSQAAD